MKRVDYTADAWDDLRDVKAYFKPLSKAKGIRTIASIRRRCRHHANFSNTGSDRSEYGNGIRSSAVGDYVVYFRYTDPGIVVLHVFHGARDVTKDDFD